MSVPVEWPAATSASPAIRRAVGPLLLAATFVGLCVGSWRCWHDPVVDFGREVYLAWRLAEGDVLYRDVAHLNGPLSPYFNAGLFRVFGPALDTLIWFNLGLAGLLTVIIYRVVASWCDQIAALLAGMVFLCVGAFNHLAYIGNYNFICPYSHEITHGLFVCVVMLLILGRCVAGPCGMGHWWAAGLCFGLVFLTKPEVFLAATVAVGWAGLLVVMRHTSIRRALAAAGAFAAGAAAPVGGFLLLLSRDVPVREALVRIAGGWPALLEGRVAGNAFYRKVMGTHNLGENVATMFGSALGIALLGVAVFLLDRAAGLSGRARARRVLGSVLPIGGACLVSGGAVLQAPRVLDGRPLPLLMLLVCSLATRAAWKRRRSDERHAAVLALWSAFGLALLAKCLFNVRLSHYGFALAMPAVIVLALVAWASVRGVAPGSRIASRLAIALVLADCAFCSHVTLSRCARKTVSVGTEGDRFLAYRGVPEDSASDDYSFRITQPGPVVREIIAAVEQHVPRDATLAVLPEGALINYLTRRRSSIPYVNFMLPELQIFGESTMLRAFENSPPDFVLLVDRATVEYGYRCFGTHADYGARLMQWILSRYEPVAQLGEPRTECSQGIVLLRAGPSDGSEQPEEKKPRKGLFGLFSGAK